MSTPAATGSATGSGTSSSSKEAILALLGIPTHLCDHSDHSLLISYQKYKAHLEATQAYERMVADGSWTGNKLHAVEFIELFVSKSFWHSHVRKYFSMISNHPVMVEWLENGEDRLSDLDLWGVEKSSYTFKDLDAYLERAESKGKKKAKEDKVKKDKVKGDKNGHKKTKKHVM